MRLTDGLQHIHFAFVRYLFRNLSTKFIRCLVFFPGIDFRLIIAPMIDGDESLLSRD